jgi:hypothetical protein
LIPVLLEDTIELKNISVPDNHPEIDLNCIYSPSSPPNTLEFKDEDQQKGVSPSASLVNMNRLVHVPSMSTIYSVKKTLAEHAENQGVLQPGAIQIPLQNQCWKYHSA